MTPLEIALTVAAAALATFITRSLPFAVFTDGRKTPAILTYLGRALPPTVFGMLVVYCLKNLSLGAFPHALPELIGITAVIILHLLFRKMLVSIVGGTAIYLILVNLVFV